MQPPGELNRFALTESDRRSGIGFCFVQEGVPDGQGSLRAGVFG